METVQRTDSLENIIDQMTKEGITRRGFLRTLAGLGATMIGGKAFAGSTPAISPEAYAIWEKYPSMIKVLNLLNEEKATGKYKWHEIEYLMFPDKTSIPKDVGEFNNYVKISGQQFQTPQYWLLLKLIAPRNPEVYDDIFNMKEIRGITNRPTNKNNLGVWYFGRGLVSQNSSRESDLLKALYIGATGSENGANAILTGSYMRMPNVQSKVKEWKDKYNYAPFSDEGNHLGAYLKLTIKQIKDKELVALTLLALAEHYASNERKNVMISVTDNFVKMGMPNYYIDRDNKYIVPINIF